LRDNYEFRVAKHSHADTFNLSLSSESLSVKRTDLAMGWGQDLNVIVREVSSGEERIINIGPSDAQLKSVRVSLDELFRDKCSSYGDDFVRSLRVYRLESRKIRVGSRHDGGYVINEALFSACSRLVSLGIGWDDTFEREWLWSKPECPVECYDGSCYCGELCRQNPEKVQKQIYHIKNYAGYGIDQIPLDVIVGGKSDILLKVDIEGGEYSLFDNADLSGVVGLIMEVHDLDDPRRRSTLAGMIRGALRDFVLFHLHGNVYGASFPLVCSETIVEEFPKVLELSFARSTLVQSLGLETEAFPKEGVDFTNDARTKDFELSWVNLI